MRRAVTGHLLHGIGFELAAHRTRLSKANRNLPFRMQHGHALVVLNELAQCLKGAAAEHGGVSQSKRCLSIGRNCETHTHSIKCQN